jgi:hypothetical protein
MTDKEKVLNGTSTGEFKRNEAENFIRKKAFDFAIHHAEMSARNGNVYSVDEIISGAKIIEQYLLGKL